MAKISIFFSAFCTYFHFPRNISPLTKILMLVLLLLIASSQGRVYIISSSPTQLCCPFPTAFYTASIIHLLLILYLSLDVCYIIVASCPQVHVISVKKKSISSSGLPQKNDFHFWQKYMYIYVSFS